ncbi:hypothetical protein [Methylobacter sp. S3L5C]|uniref:hypothetical protein n=1 Tax=Methylobacter sp. S3L5C TaxID=2839024 RepID=UPI001FAB86EB|nr:hypothetical protein [Methylobacter sp. S3L5C]UOA08331.1 hypothetical protein KKZ03_19345 [Methylobacter sp. S3L5C]
MYAIIALVLLAFAVGYGSAWKVSQKTIITLESNNAVQAESARRIINESTDKITKATAQATIELQRNEDLAIKNSKSVAANAVLLAATRLHDPGKPKRCPDRLPKNSSSKEPEATHDSDPSELSAEFTNFLQHETNRADTIAVYAESCRQFVQSNCGIAP